MPRRKPLPEAIERAVRLFAAIGKVYPFSVGWGFTRYYYPRLIIYTDDMMELDWMLRIFGGSAGIHFAGKEYFYWYTTSKRTTILLLRACLKEDYLKGKRLVLAMWALLLAQCHWSEFDHQRQIAQEMKAVIHSMDEQVLIASRQASLEQLGLAKDDGLGTDQAELASRFPALETSQDIVLPHSQSEIEDEGPTTSPPQQPDPQEPPLQP